MKKIITNILTDKGMRGDSAVEAALLRQAVASPWYDTPTS